MSEFDMLLKQQFILARLFLLPSKFQSIGGRVLAGEMTLRQWLLTLAVAQCGDDSPTLSKLAEFMGCSRQNVKQIALKLEEAGFLELKKGEVDGRVTHLSLTARSCSFWRRRQEEIREYLTELFKELSEGEIDVLYECINKLYESALKVEKSL